MTLKKFYRALSFLLVLAMMVSVLSVVSFADDVEEIEPEDNGIYVMMNVPYSEFYAAELTEGASVDVVSSATKSKTMNAGLVAGSYHAVSDGTEITGVCFPVKVESLDVLADCTAAETQDALFSNASHAYCVLTEAPAVYKELTVADGVFTYSETKGTVTELTDASATITAQSQYGDYQINVSGLPEEATTVYGVVLKTATDSYGLRHLENIWRISSLAFSIGIVTTAHGNTLSYEAYESLNGQTITEIEYITNAGVYTIPVELYAQKKNAETAVTVANGTCGDGSVAVTVTGLPEGYEPVYTVSGLNGSVADGVLTYTGAAIGSYTLTVSDATGTYAPLSASFTLSTEQVVAAYDADNCALVAAEGVSADDFAAYLKAITSVTINGTTYTAGRRGVTIVNSTTGAIDTSKNVEGENTFVVTATGYPELTFSMVTNNDIYVMMNVPYSEFYAADLTEGASVDAVASATKAKTMNAGLVAGSYHAVSDGTEITGVCFPVKVESLAVLADCTAVETEDALFSNASHAYYVMDAAAVPAVYKELTVADGVFTYSETKGTVTELTDATASITAQSQYGDYQINVTGLPAEATTVYGVVLKTATDSYGLRHLENIWRISSLAFSIGIVTTAHGNTLSYEAYESLNGQTITEIDYITNAGVYTIPVELYAQKKNAETAVTVANGTCGDGSVAVTVTGLPEGYEPVYTVSGLGAYTVENGTLMYADAAIGSYTLTVSDATGVYAPLSASFTLSTEQVMAAYDAASGALVAAEGVSAENFAAYLKAITSVTINDTTYTAGRRGVTIVNATTGAIDTSKNVEGENTFVVTATGYPELTFSVVTNNDIYVMMNVPYSEFYAADLTEGASVDAVASATKAKTMNAGLVAGSYHAVSDGTEITGVCFPVKVESLAVLADCTAVETEDALFSNASHAYYVMDAAAVPTVYKELTVADGVFTYSETKGTAAALTDASATITAESQYGDYQINVTGLPAEATTVYGVVLKTANNSYGLRHLENIWRVSSLAFSVGIVTTAHGNTLSYEAYQSMVGQTITEIEYITNAGVYTIPVELKVLTKNADAKVTVANGTCGDGSVAVTVTGLPEDYVPVYTVSGLNGSVADGVLTYTGAAIGSYTLTVSDATGTYAPLSASFTLSTEQVMAAYDAASGALVAAEGVSAEDFAAYLKAISAVTINGTRYNASGRMSTKIVDSATGAINTSKNVEGQNTYVVTATGYPDLEFSITAGWAETEQGKVYYNGYGIMVTGVYNVDGTLYYFNASGILQTNKKGWQKINGNKYYFNSDGTAVGGWKTISKKDYYFDPDTGVMTTLWREIDGSWYYFGTDGKKVTGWKTIKDENKVSNKYYFGKDGKMVTSWQTISKKNYYFDPDTGVMATKWCVIDGNQYYFGTTGVKATGFQTISKAKYYFDADGIMQTGLKKIPSGKKTYIYYFNTAADYAADETAVVGKMVTGWKLIGNDYYYFASTGKAAIGWASIKYNKVTSKYYFNEEGIMQTSWLNLGTKWYYLNEDGTMLKSDLIEWEGNRYYFNSSGVMVTGLQTVKCSKLSGKCYFDENGALQTSRLIPVGKKTYYFDDNGLMVKKDWRVVDGKTYYFDASGYMVKNKKMKITVNGTKAYYTFDADGVCQNAPEL